MHYRAGHSSAPFRRSLRWLFISIALAVVAGCGSESSGDSPAPAPATALALDGAAGSENVDAPTGSLPSNDDGSTTTPTDTDESGFADDDATVLPAPDDDGPVGATTRPPDEGDEPAPQDPRFHTSTDLPVFENPPRTAARRWSDISEAEFAAGPLEPVLIAPSDHDPASNRPPYFPNLQNVTVAAGETLELHLAPIDPDGGVAGQYLKELYPGSVYRDNFDTTRTFVWRPLEPDVGIRDFTVFTVDPAEPALRVRYTIRIRVVMPNDPSSIENLTPGIDRIPAQTVRVGDAVVLNVKGTDPNGTIPRVEVLDTPPGTTFMRHRDDPRIRVVRFVPTVPGLITLRLIAHDARNPQLTHAKTVEIDVQTPETFARSGERLRDLADARDFLIGFASTTTPYHRADGALYLDTAAEEFNLVTPENSMKWDRLNPQPGVYNWAHADNLVAWASARNLIVHGHTLVWYTQLPSWVKDTAPEVREGHMRDFIDRVLTRYKDTVPIWDVVNESLDSDGGLRDSIWLEAMGPDYIEKAFRQARASAPDATLLYNEYDVGWAGPKADGLFRLLDTLKAADTPIDGVGFQMHVDADFELFHELAANLAEAASRDLDVYITELDVSIRNGQTEAQQAAVYRGVLSTCLAEPRCKALQSWGFTDRYSWQGSFEPLIFDLEYQPKAAYLALQRRLGEN